MMASSFDTTLAKLGISRSNAGPTVRTAAQADTLSQNDFIKLLTAQLRNQDPTSPVDATQQLTQLAQFSSVAGISEMNSTLKAIQEKLSATTTSDALGYVGRNVLIAGDTAFPRVDGGLSGAIELEGDASAVRVNILNDNGETIKTLSLGAQNRGTVEFEWDGNTENGQPAGTGPFKISISANKDDKTVGATPLVWAPVAAVSVPAKGPAILTVPGLGQIPTTAVRKIG